MTKFIFPAIEARKKLTQQRKIEQFSRAILLNEVLDGSKVMTLDLIQGDKLMPRYEGL